MNVKHVDTLMDPSFKLVPDKGELYFDLGRYRRLVGKLNYLTVTHPYDPCNDCSKLIFKLSLPKPLRFNCKTPTNKLIYKDNGNTQIIG